MRTVRYFLSLVLCAALCTSSLHADHHLKSVDLVGVWNAVATTDDGAREVTWTFKKESDKLTGVSLDRENGNERDIDRITVKEKKVTLEIDIEQDGNKGLIKVETEENSAGKLVGEWSIVGDDGTEYLSGEVTAQKEVSFAGEWDATSMLPNGNTLDTLIKLTGKNSTLKGVFSGENGETPIKKITVSGNEIHLDFSFDMNGNTINGVIKSEAKGNDKLVGKWIVINEAGEEAAEGEWSAMRKPKGLAGTWAVVATVPDNADYTGTLTLAVENGKYSGSSKGSNSEAKTLTTVKVDTNKIVFSLPFEAGDYTGTITVEAKQKEDGSLDGEWILVGNDGNEYARESWKATRK